jgi:hypothetical protein
MGEIYRRVARYEAEPSSWRMLEIILSALR